MFLDIHAYTIYVSQYLGLYYLSWYQMHEYELWQ